MSYYRLLSSNSAPVAPANTRQPQPSTGKTVSLSTVSLSTPAPILQVSLPAQVKEDNLSKLNLNDQYDHTSHSNTRESRTEYVDDSQNETLEIIDTLIEIGGGADAFTDVPERNQLYKMVIENVSSFHFALTFFETSDTNFVYL